jgi:hemolysin D
VVTENKKPIQIKPALVSPVKHPLKVANLMYQPPSHVLRGPIYMVVIILFAVLIYSFWAKKDILVMAPLVLDRQTTLVEAVGGGLVYELPVKENQIVKSGDELAVIQEQTSVAMTPVQESLESRKADLEKERRKFEEEINHQIAQAQLDLEDLTTSKGSKKVALTGRIKQIEEQLDTSFRAKRRRQEQLKLAQKQLDRKKKLFTSHDITISEYEQAQEKVSELQKLVDDTQAEIAKIKVSLQTAKTELAEMSDLHRKEKLEKDIAQLQYRRDTELQHLDESIAAVEQRIAQAEYLIEGVTYKDNSAEYASLFDGLVTDVHVKRGEVITPGTPLVTIVKESAALEARVLVDNKDIGHLKRGQDVKIKYFAYPYQEYGIHEGRISSIAKKPSTDANEKSK